MTRWLLLLFAPALATALDPSLAISQYTYKHWQVEEGLPQNYVTAIAQASDGALLVGTSGGVARFDGSQFRTIVLDSKSGLTREWINSLLVDSHGTVWIASRDAGLFHHRDGRTSRPLVHGLRFTTMSELPRGEGAALGAGALWRMRAGEWSRQLSSLDGGDLNWEGLLPLPDGRILVGASTGLHAVSGNQATLILPDTGIAGRVLSLRLGRRGTIYAGTTRGLFRLTISGDRAGASAVVGVDGPVVSIVEDRDGLIWAATWGRGLFRVHKGTVSSWTNARGFLDDFVRMVYEDTEGNIWVGTRGGLSRLTAGPIIPHGPAEGLGGQFVSAVAGGPDGSLWIGTWRSGLYRYRGNVFTHVRMKAPDLTTLVRSLAVTRTGTLWMSDWRGLRSFDGSRWQDHGRDELGHDPRANAIVVDRDGSLWLGAPDGLYQYPPGPIRAGGRQRLQGRAVLCLAISGDGKLWAGTDNGLALLDREQSHEIGPLPHPEVISIAQDTGGLVWAATRAGGLTLVSVSPPRTFDHRHGLPAVPALGILADGNSGLWLSTASGIYQIPGAEIRSLLRGGRVTPQRYSQHDGLRTVEAQNVGQPSAWLDSRGSLWFTTVRGAVEVRPRAVRLLPPPRVSIDSVVREADGHVVRYSAVRLSAPHRLEFRYRLSRQEEWTFAGPERVLRFSSLPAGTHRLLVSARDSGAPWGEAASIDLIEPPEWFETGWFLASLALSIGLLLWLVYRWRVLILRGRYSAVLSERNRISREWHDTLLAGFSAISWQLEATLNRLRDKPETASESLDLARKMVRHYRTEARRVIWDLRNDRPDSIDLPQSIGEALASITRNSGVKTAVRVEGKFPVLSGELGLNLLRIAQEAAANALHHASPCRIEIRLRGDGEAVELSVHDDGCGFDPMRVQTGHFGLAIMRERAERFGGRVSFESNPGGGTIVRARIPWKP